MPAYEQPMDTVELILKANKVIIDSDVLSSKMIWKLIHLPDVYLLYKSLTYLQYVLTYLPA